MVVGSPSLLLPGSCTNKVPMGEFVYADTAAEGIILSLFMSNEQ